MFLNWYRLVEAYRGADTSTATFNTLEGRQISKFDWLVAFVVPDGSKYIRGFAILPRSLFLNYGGIECSFFNGTISNYADITYVNDTQVTVGTSNPYGTMVYLFGISVGLVL